MTEKLIVTGITFGGTIQKLINSVDFERKEAYLYLKNGLVLFLKGHFECTNVGLLVQDMGEVSIFEYNHIAGFKILKKTVPAEEVAEEEDDDDVEIDLTEVGAQREAEMDGYNDR